MSPEIAKALLAIQKELLPIKKGSTGQTGKRTFTYADLQSLWEAIHPLLCKHDLVLTQALQSNDKGTFLVSQLTHVSGAVLSSEVKIEFTGDDIKEFGSAISYYRRYATQCIFSIVTTDKDVEQMDKPIRKKEPIKDSARKGKISPDQVDEIVNLLIDNNLEEWFQGILERRGYKYIKDIDEDKYAATIDFIKARA